MDCLNLTLMSTCAVHASRSFSTLFSSILSVLCIFQFRILCPESGFHYIHFHFIQKLSTVQIHSALHGKVEWVLDAAVIFLNVSALTDSL